MARQVRLRIQIDTGITCGSTYAVAVVAPFHQFPSLHHAGAEGASDIARAEAHLERRLAEEGHLAGLARAVGVVNARLHGFRPAERLLRPSQRCHGHRRTRRLLGHVHNARQEPVDRREKRGGQKRLLVRFVRALDHARDGVDGLYGEDEHVHVLLGLRALQHGLQGLEDVDARAEQVIRGRRRPLLRHDVLPLHALPPSRVRQRHSQRRQRTTATKQLQHPQHRHRPARAALLILDQSRQPTRRCHSQPLRHGAA
eukprot:23214-Rhodomonas_salina.1